MNRNAAPRSAIPARPLAAAGPCAGLTAASILACERAVLAASASMPRLLLLRAERMALGGHVFAESPDLVDAVCSALYDEPELFAAAPYAHLADAGALAAQAERASAWGRLRGCFELLAGHAAELHLAETAAATQVALTLVKAARTEAELPGASDEAWLRLDALHGAERVLRGRTEKKRAGRGRAAPRDREEPQKELHQLGLELAFARFVSGAPPQAPDDPPPPVPPPDGPPPVPPPPVPPPARAATDLQYWRERHPTLDSPRAAISLK